VSCLPVYPSVWKNSVPNGWISIKFDIGNLQKFDKKIHVSLKSDMNNEWVLYMKRYIHF